MIELPMPTRRTFAAVAALLGVTEERVGDLVDFGPLVARQHDDGRWIHDDDLAAFRRPIGVVSDATTRNEVVAGCSDHHESGSFSPDEVYITPRVPRKPDPGRGGGVVDKAHKSHLRLVRP